MILPLPPAISTDITAFVREGYRFGTIYADPPWQYGNTATRSSADGEYDGTLSVEELRDLPVPKLVADTAHLHLWTTNAFIFDAKTVLDAWGFEYKSLFVWVKPKLGMGNYWRVSHEFMLLGVRGPGATFRDRSLQSWLHAGIGRHSAKPERVRSMIECASPGPYLELFGRRVVDGWSVWGNQIERDLFSEGISELS